MDRGSPGPKAASCEATDGPVFCLLRALAPCGVSAARLHRWAAIWRSLLTSLRQVAGTEVCVGVGGRGHTHSLPCGCQAVIRDPGPARPACSLWPRWSQPVPPDPPMCPPPPLVSQGHFACMENNTPMSTEECYLLGGQGVSGRGGCRKAQNPSLASLLSACSRDSPVNGSSPLLYPGL